MPFLSFFPTRAFYNGPRFFFGIAVLGGLPFLLNGCVKPSVHQAALLELAGTRGQLERAEDENKVLKSGLAKADLEIQALEEEIVSLKNSEKNLIQDQERLAEKNIELSSEVAKLTRLSSALSETTQHQDLRLEKLRKDLLEEAEAKKKEETLRLQLLQEVEARRREMDRIKSTHNRLVGELQKEIQEGEIRITQALDKLSVNLVEKILFDSGRATIKPKGLEVLNRVGEILSKLDDKEIQVHGHTDNVPIGGKLKEKYPSNWELSAARAISVVRYLSETAGIEARFLSAVGQGDSQPFVSNDTPEGRSQNRRIEIVLSPLEVDPILEQLKPNPTNPPVAHDKEKSDGEAQEEKASQEEKNRSEAPPGG